MNGLRALPGTSGSIAVALLVAVGALSPAIGAEFTWYPTETVDLGLVEVSSEAGRSVVGLADGTAENWDVVYLKDGRVHHVARTAAMWGTPEPLSPEGITARTPQIARTGNVLHVVWEDSRQGIPEIWTRRWEAGVWSPETCLTGDGVPSSAPSLAADQRCVLAWQDLAAGQGRVFAAFFQDGAWAAPEPVSAAGVSAAEPAASILTSLGFDVAMIAWSDLRHGEPEIYVRLGSPTAWEPETRVTELSGSCVRPCIRLETCCLDYISLQGQLTFLNNAGGVYETWSAKVSQDYPPNVTRISPDDGLPSRHACVDGFPFAYGPLVPFGGPSPVDLTAWSEGTPGGPGKVIVTPAGSASSADTTCLSRLSDGGPVLGAIAGNPLAGDLVLWTEPSGSVRVLKARLGSILGCEIHEAVPPASFLIAPEGIPGNTFRVFDTCSETFINNHAQAFLTFNSTLDAALTWDSGQPHPSTPSIYPNANGEWIFNIRGGGCSEDGFVLLGMNGIYVTSCNGARSPDVNGDCMVLADDREYVESHAGTSDFCADLDGSGLVDVADLAIVDATMGDICAIASVDGELAVSALALRVIPNPARASVALRVETGRAGPVALSILDASGRCIRDLGERPFPSGGSAVLWDARDGGGHPAAAGVYFVIARSGGETVRKSLILMR